MTRTKQEEKKSLWTETMIIKTQERGGVHS